MAVKIITAATAQSLTTKKGVGEMAVEPKEIPGTAVELPELHARVSVMVGYTKNLGNFESLKVEVSVEVPCENTDAAMEDAAAFASGFCESQIDEIVNK